MASTFFGLTIAGSGLSAFQAAVNTTANNISNVKTNGYTRQEAVRVAADAIRTNQRYGTAGSGVNTTEIRQIRDYYYDERYWQNNTRVGLYDTKLYYMQQVEDYLIDDDSAKGFGTILNEMFSTMDTLKATPDDPDARKQFISKSQNFTNFFNSMSEGLSQVQEDANKEISTQVNNINSIAQKISILNKQINVIEQQGSNANELRDQRALLIDELSGLAPVEVTETKVSNKNFYEMYTGATEYVVKINGQLLVDSYDYNTLKCVAREDKVNQSDVDGLYDIYWEKTDIKFTAGTMSGGRLRGLFDIRDGNNAENFSATVSGVASGANGDIVTLSTPSITNVNDMTMPGEGTININNKDYKYTGFSFDEATGTYQFQLEGHLGADERTMMVGKNAEIGSRVDAMGIPYYMAQANSFLREFTKQFNEIQKEGVNMAGNQPGAFFVAENPADGSQVDFGDFTGNNSMSSTGNYYYQLTAANAAVSNDLVKHPENMATLVQGQTVENAVSNPVLVEKMLALKHEVKMFRGGGADSFLQCLISDNTVDTSKAQQFYKNYNNLSESIVQKRMSISGVDEDEEALDLLKFQNAYDLASKMIQTLSEMYDRLILETGV